MNARADFIWNAPLELDGAQAHVLCDALDTLLEPRDSAQDLAQQLGPLTPAKAAVHLRAVAISLQGDARLDEVRQGAKDLAFELEHFDAIFMLGYGTDAEQAIALAYLTKEDA